MFLWLALGVTLGPILIYRLMVLSWGRSESSCVWCLATAKIPPGYLTEHGTKLMILFGAYDHEFLAKEGLLAADGCADAEHVAIPADSDSPRGRRARLSLSFKSGAQSISREIPLRLDGDSSSRTNNPCWHPAA